MPGITDLLKIVPDMLKALPLALKALIYLVVKIPKMIFNIIKNITKFIKKAIPLAFAVIISFLIVFFGIQYLFSQITGLGTMLPHAPLAVFSLYIVYELVMNEGNALKTFQSMLLNGFLLIFNNPLTKDILGFDVEIDKKNPGKSFIKILKWVSKNIVKIILTLFFVAFMLKISLVKIWGYITFYMN
jgi:hypothetical protein